MTTKKNEVAVTMGSSEVAVYSETDLKSWGGNEGSAKDIVIPALILCQQMSDFVAVENIAKMGDYVDSVSHKNFGPVLKDLVPFYMQKSWQVEKTNAKGKYEYVRTEPMDINNENLPYEFEEGGAKMRRLYTYRFFVMVPGEILPYTLKLKSSSRNAGKELFTEMYVKNMMGKPQLPPAGRTFTLASKTEKNDDGTFAVSTIKMGERTPHERVMEAFEWLKSVRSDNAVVVDDKDF